MRGAVSDQTKADLDAAIAAHFADEQDGAIVTGYALQVQGTGFTDERDGDRVRMLRALAEGQNYITTLGLIDWMRVTAQAGIFDDDEEP
jgi:hypothetical protein